MSRFLRGMIEAYLKDFMVSFLADFGHRSKSNRQWGSAGICSITCLKLNELSWKLKSEHRSQSVLKGSEPKDPDGSCYHHGPLLKHMPSKREKIVYWQEGKARRGLRQQNYTYT